MKRSLLLFFIASAFVFFTSCHKSETGPHFSAEINGSLWQPTETVVGGVSGDTLYVYADQYISTHYIYSGGFALQITGFSGVGTYQLDSPTVTAYYLNYLGPPTYYYGRTGKIVVSSYTHSSMTGKFDFTTSDSVKTITNGVFYVNW